MTGSHIPVVEDPVSWGVFRDYVDGVNFEFARLWRIIRELEQNKQSSATTITLNIGGSNMPGQITVDTTNETATLGFVDDKWNPAAEPVGAAFTFSSDNEAVATVAADASNPLQADITPVGIGSANISATSNGTALEGDGSTPIADPAPVAVTVAAGVAAGEVFTLSA